VAIENYTGFEEISGLALIQKFEKHLRKQKINIRAYEVSELKKINDNFSVFTKERKQFEAKAVIVATGAEPKLLNVPGEKEFIGRGVSYCVACDGPMFNNKTVAVIGGGNSSLEAAVFLETYAKKIYILEYSSRVKADISLQEKVRKFDKIDIIMDAAVKEISGDKFVNSIIYQNLKIDQKITLPVDGIFVEIGLRPAASSVKNLVDFNERNEIIIDPKTNETKTVGLFAAGDVGSIPYKQIIISAGDGAKAALSANNYIKRM